MNHTFSLPPLFSVFALLVSFTPLAADESAEPIDLILVAGQSNAVGFNAMPSKLPGNPDDKNVLFWWRCGDPPPDDHDTTSGGKQWTFLQPQPLGTPMDKKKMQRQYGNYAQKDGGFGPEIGMARFLRKQNPDRPLAIVKAAFSGTGIRKDWNPEDKTGDSGVCYRALLSETKAAIAAAEADGKTLKIRALVWVQGESDANPNDVAHYQKALAEMIAALRRDLEAPEMAALIAVNTKFGQGKNAMMPKIVDAQNAAANADPLCVYVDTAEATIANAAHYDTQGTIDVGTWFGEAYLKLVTPNDKKGDLKQAALDCFGWVVRN